ALGAEMLILAGVAKDVPSARVAMQNTISSGKALDRFRRIVERQGGDPSVLDDPSKLPQARECEIYNAPRAGFVAKVEPRAIGRGIIELGGGRRVMADTI